MPRALEMYVDGSRFYSFYLTNMTLSRIRMWEKGLGENQYAVPVFHRLLQPCAASVLYGVCAKSWSTNYYESAAPLAVRDSFVCAFLYIDR